MSKCNWWISIFLVDQGISLLTAVSFLNIHEHDQISEFITTGFTELLKRHFNYSTNFVEVNILWKRNCYGEEKADKDGSTAYTPFMSAVNP